MKSGSQSLTLSMQCIGAASRRHLASDKSTFFWQQWQQYRDYLYRCCIKWMGGNYTDAEDALSRAMLKAWEKVQKYEEKITNFKAWLTSLTHNLCVDIYRERSRGANRVKNIEAIGEERGMISIENTPEKALETDEKKIVIRRAIDRLPTRMRETFILHFYQDLSYQEIAEMQEISYQNVCKRISQARAILREELKGYFIEGDGTETDTVKVAAKPAKSQKAAQKADRVESILPETVTLSSQLEKGEKTKTELAATSAVTEPTIEEISEGNAEVGAIVEESVTLSVAIAQVESVASAEPPCIAVSQQNSELDSVAATAAGKLSQFNLIEKQIVGALFQWIYRYHTGKIGNSELFDRLRQLVLEVRREGCQYVEMTLCEMNFTPILTLAKFEEEMGGWESSCMPVRWEL